MKKAQFCIAAVLMTLCASLAQAAQVKYMTFAAPPATASTYSYWVAMGKVIQTLHPEYRISVSESQGATDIMKKIRSGVVSMGNGMTNSDYESYNGLVLFKGKPYKDLRVMWLWDRAPLIMMVTQESGVKYLKDLEAKKFNPGGTGTSAAIMAKQVLEVAGVQPNYFEAGQASAADAVANRQIMGMVKTGQATGMDSLFLQLQAAMPMTLVTMTEEEVANINARYPYLVPSAIPAGTYSWITEDIHTVEVSMSVLTTTRLPQEDAYKMISAMDSPEGRKLWNPAYPAAANLDLFAMTLQSQLPLHAGTVQYFKEKGIPVPDRLIPPEYKE